MMCIDDERCSVMCPRHGQSVDKPDTASGRPYRDGMRWAALFADLELQLEAVDARERASVVADLTRAVRSSVHLRVRFRASEGRSVRLHLRGGAQVEGVLDEVGPAWALLSAQGREHLVPLASVAFAAGLVDVAAPPQAGVLSRLPLGHALRAIARDRTVVRVLTSGGEVVGRIDGVAADHVDVTLVHADSRRPTGERRAVPVAELLLVGSL